MLLRLMLSLLGFVCMQGGFEIIYRGHALSGEFRTDHLENIYYIDNHKIVKVETGTGNTMEYGSLSDGDITDADVSNPLQIILFYRDFNRIVLLDNKLARLRSAISATELGIEQALLVCSSGRGGFWVFSDRSNRLVYFDRQLRNSHQGMIISSITGTNIKPVFMTKAGNLLYLHVPGEGILLFDRFAAYLETIPYSGPDRFQVLDGKIVYFMDGELLSLDIESLDIESIALPAEKKIDNAQLQPKRLFLLSDKEISLFILR